jgi:hypothetical protein
MEHKLIREDLVLCPDIEGYSFVENGVCETCGDSVQPEMLKVLETA